MGINCTPWVSIVPCGYQLYHVGINCTLWVSIVPCGYQLYHVGINCTLWVSIVPCGYQLYHVGINCTLWVSIVPCGYQLYHVGINCTLWVSIVPCGVSIVPAVFEIKLLFDAPAGCRSFKTVHPAATLCILLIYSNGKELKKCAHTGRTRPKIVRPAAEMCTPGAECTLNFEHCTS